MATVCTPQRSNQSAKSFKSPVRVAKLRTGSALSRSGGTAATCILAPTSTAAAFGPPRPETVTKVLWVDDHPQNNIGLQYAFQTLGIVVVCIDSNEGIQQAFRTSGGFDVNNRRVS